MARDWNVRLLMGIENDDAETPIEAVEEFIDNINNLGIRSFTFRVIDPDGVTHLVQDGTSMSEEEAMDFLRNMDPDDIDEAEAEADMIVDEIVRNIDTDDD